MTATSALTSRRCALAATLVLVLATAQLGLWRHHQPPSVAAVSAAWTLTGSSGTVGTASLTDTAANPGASCRVNRAASPPFVAILATGPTVSPSAGNPTQVVGWRAVLAQVLADSTVAPLSTTAYVTATASSSQPVALPAHEFLFQPLGPNYIVLAEVVWYDPTTPSITGTETYRIGFYRPLNDSGTQTGQAGTACRSPLSPTAFIPAPRGTVNGLASYSLSYFPSTAALAVTWDGKPLGTATTAANGTLASVFAIPATPVGYHTVRWSTGNWSASATFEVVPRIKITPATVGRGQSVSVSLRGFAKKETVRIRWKRGGSWVELATVLTSNTGSANTTVPVPAWAEDGATSVRGDGPVARAQTNAVTVQGGAFRAAEDSATPTETPSASPTPSATVSPTPAESATATPSDPAFPDASPTATFPDVIPTPTDEPAPTATPTESPPVPPSPTPSDTPTTTPSPTDVPLIPVEPTVEIPD